MARHLTFSLPVWYNSGREEKNNRPKMRLTMLTKVIENKKVEIKVGDILQLDCGSYKELRASEWEDAEFIYENPVFGWESPIHVNLELSGRTIQYRTGKYWVRVRITWVKDCEPNTYGSGWVQVNPWKCDLVN